MLIIGLVHTSFLGALTLCLDGRLTVGEAVKEVGERKQSFEALVGLVSVLSSSALLCACASLVCIHLYSLPLQLVLCFRWFSELLHSL